MEPMTTKAKNRSSCDVQHHCIVFDAWYFGFRDAEETGVGLSTDAKSKSNTKASKQECGLGLIFAV